VLKQTQQDHWIVRAVRDERLRLEDELLKAEHEISWLAKEIRNFRDGVPSSSPSKPLTPEESADRSDAIIRAWRSGETYQAIGERYGRSRERVRQIVAKREREERRSLDATIQDALFTQIPGRILYGQEYEFTAEDPETPIVRVPRGAQTNSGHTGYIRYEKT
jgi:hypothetical protein